jgi:hypothetical protein
MQAFAESKSEVSDLTNGPANVVGANHAVNDRSGTGEARRRARSASSDPTGPNIPTGLSLRGGSASVQVPVRGAVTSGLASEINSVVETQDRLIEQKLRDICRGC